MWWVSPSLAPCPPPTQPGLSLLVFEAGVVLCVQMRKQGLNGNTRFSKSRKPLDRNLGWWVGWPVHSLGAAGDSWASIRQDVFTEVVGQKRQKPGPDRGAKRRREEARQRDQAFYVPYRPKDFESERG